jgi:hypothetical protein
MKLRPQLIGGLAALSMPVGYLVYKHVSWESSPQSKKRMLVHQLTFWGSVALGVTILHKTFFKRGLSNPQKFLRYLFGGAMAAQGFESGERLGNMLFPHQPEVGPAPMPRPRNLYFPSYLQTSGTWA